MRSLIALALAAGLGMTTSASALQVSENKRFLVTNEGKPFFWLGDTAWRLQLLAPQDLAYYLDARKAQGYNVIQGPVLTHGSASDLVETNSDPFNPNQAFFRRIDHIVNETDRRGLHSALVVTWGRNFNLFRDPDGARNYGRWLARRYRNRSNVIWIVAGEYAIASRSAFALSIWRALGEGLREGSGGRAVITIHGNWIPPALQTPSTFYHLDPWLSFNMIQSGQGGNITPGAANWRLIEEDYLKSPPKPVLDGEATYEGEEAPGRPAWDAFGVRRRAYWSVFAGAFGHTYGADRVFYFQEGWRERLLLKGAVTLAHLRRLMESRPMLGRIPDQSLVVPTEPESARQPCVSIPWQPPCGVPNHVQATRDADGGYAMAYVPGGERTVAIDASALSGSRLVAWWYKPDDGSASRVGEFARSPKLTFTTPPGDDWVLVLDDKARNYPAPGRRPLRRPASPAGAGGGRSPAGRRLRPQRTR
jgi:hypothetical protein